MVAGVAVYPAAWSETSVQETCGPTADQYNIGKALVILLQLGKLRFRGWRTSKPRVLMLLNTWPGTHDELRKYTSSPAGA